MKAKTESRVRISRVMVSIKLGYATQRYVTKGAFTQDAGVGASPK